MYRLNNNRKVSGRRQKHAPSRGFLATAAALVFNEPIWKLLCSLLFSSAVSVYTLLAESRIGYFVIAAYIAAAIDAASNAGIGRAFMC